MSDETFEIAGLALTTKGAKNTATRASRAKTCANCGAPVTGDYCAACGQKDVDVRRPLAAIINESLGDLFAIDSRVTRTAGRLVFEPGRVARDFVEGRRQSYVPPLRLYLFAIIALIAASWFTDAVDPDKPSVCVGLCLEFEDLDDVRATLVEVREEADTPEEAAVLDQALGLLDEVRPGFDSGVGVQVSTEESVEDFERRLRAADGGDLAIASIIDAVRKVREPDIELGVEADGADAGAALETDGGLAEAGPWLDHWRTVVKRVMGDYARFNDRVTLWVPRIFIAMAFVFALMTPMLYWRRYMAEHVVFSLYLHSGITAIMVAGTLIAAIPNASFVWGLALLYLPYFIGASLRRFFGGRRWTTILRMLFALALYSLGLGVLIALAALREAVRLSGVPWSSLSPFGPIVTATS